MKYILVLLLMVAHAANAATGSPGQTIFDKYGLAPAPQPSEALHQFENFRSQAKKGGVLRMSHDSPIDLVFPYSMKDGRPFENAPNVESLYEGLMTTHPFASSRTLYTLTAKQYWIDRQNLTLTVEINPEARFWNGDAVTADDLVFSWEIFSLAYNGEKGTKFMKDIYGSRVEVKALTPMTVQFYFPELSPEKLSDGLYYLFNLAIVKPWDKARVHEVKVPYMGTGPYQIESVNRSQLTLRRDPQYWASQHPMRKNLFNFDQLKALVYRDQDVARMSFAGRNLDVFFETSSSAEASLDETGKVQGFSRRQLQKWERDVSSRVLGFNMAHVDTGRLAFRKAIALAIDFDFANRSFYNSTLNRLRAPGQLSDYSPKGQLSTAAQDLLRQAPAAPPGEVFSAYETYGYLSLPFDLSNRERLKVAMKLLFDDGYKLVGSRLTRDGRPVELELLTMSPNPSDKILGLFRSTLAQMGIQLTIRSISDSSAYTSQAKKRNYDLIFEFLPIQRQFESLNTNYVRQALHSSNAMRTDHVTNLVNLKNPFVDWLVEELAVNPPSSPKFRPLSELLLRSMSALLPFALVGEKTQTVLYANDHICTVPWTTSLIETSYYSEKCTESLPRH